MKKRFFLVITIFVTVLLLFTGCQKEVVSTNSQEEKSKEVLDVIGGNVNRLYGKEAGITLDDLPYVNSISYKEWKSMEEIPETGIFRIKLEK